MPDILQQVVNERPGNENSSSNPKKQSKIEGQELNKLPLDVPDPPPKPLRTFKQSLSRDKETPINWLEKELDAQNQNPNNSSNSSHELYHSCLDTTTSGDGGRTNDCQQSSSTSSSAVEQNSTATLSTNPNSYCTPSIDNNLSAVNPAVSAISCSIEGTPLATSSPKVISADLLESNESITPPAVPIRRSSFTSAIQGQMQMMKPDGVKLTEDEVYKIYQETNPLERLAKLNSLKAKQSNVVHDMIMNR